VVQARRDSFFNTAASAKTVRASPERCMKPYRLASRYLAIGLAVALTTVAVTATAFYLIYQNALSELAQASIAANESVLGARLQDYAADMAASLAAELRPAVEADDQPRIQALLDTGRRLSGANLVLLRDAGSNTTLYSGDRSLDPGSDSSIQGLRDELLYTRSLIDADDPRWQLVQVFDVSVFLGGNDTLRNELAYIELEAKRLSLVSLLGFGLLLLLCIAALAAFVAFRQIRTIKALVHGASSLAEGDYSAELPLDSRHELGELASTFKDMRERLRETTISRDYLDSVLASMVDAIILIDDKGIIARVNPAACELLEYPAEQLIGRAAIELVAPAHRRHFGAADRRQKPAESVFLAGSGTEVPVSYSWADIHDGDDGSDGAIISARNISERKVAEQRIRYLARIDALTKVPNRMQFQHLLQRAIARAKRRGHRLGLLYLDVDRFKDINDTFGHMAGDASLETLTSRVGMLLPDGAFMGRLAGDEFGIVVRLEGDRESNERFLSSLASELLRGINEVLIVQGHELYITASVGIACFPSDADNVLDLIRNADAALYVAKGSGGNRSELYNPDMNAQAVERLMLKSKLRRSFERDELLVNYQPKLSLRSGEIVGAEALVRWELTEHGILLPSEFIPLAEETNLILEIGEWVLNRVCTDIAGWQKELSDIGRISINLSLKQLGQQDFVRRIGRIVKRHELAMDCLEFEITESTLMQDPERTIAILRELADMGLHLAIDDFGTGYSSLSALQQFPIDTLKVDRSFVRDAATDKDDATIVTAILEMARSMGMTVVAEGVEDEAQLSFLRSIDCDYVQGLLFGDPVDADQYLELLRDQQAGSGSYRSLFG
jgi:diguanylate cyclase (GGDEF)-like protein/PAS domain S-box-containing protein